MSLSTVCFVLLVIVQYFIIYYIFYAILFSHKCYLCISSLLVLSTLHLYCRWHIICAFSNFSCTESFPTPLLNPSNSTFQHKCCTLCVFFAVYVIWIDFQVIRIPTCWTNQWIDVFLDKLAVVVPLNWNTIADVFSCKYFTIQQKIGICDQC